MHPRNNDDKLEYVPCLILNVRYVKNYRQTQIKIWFHIRFSKEQEIVFLYQIKFKSSIQNLNGLWNVIIRIN